MTMAAKMNPQFRPDLIEVPEARDAQIFAFPANEWDRLELWARRENAKAESAVEARNAALSRI